jgi:hypothetical protein
MAIYHLSAKTIGRNQGRSATAAAAYRAAVRIVDERTGLVFDYTRKRGVDGAEILTPDGTAAERADLWNAVEKSEKRVDAQVAREIEVALPRELAPEAMRALVRSFVQEQFVARGMIADIAFHNLTGANPHAHVLLTLREWSTGAFGLKRREWNDRALCVEWRERWADHANAALADAGHAVRIDSRMLTEQAAEAAEQGETVKAMALMREPTVHERGNPSARAQNRAIVARNATNTPEAHADSPEPSVRAVRPADDDAAFIAAMLARPGTDAARWRLYHTEAQAAAAWLQDHANDKQQRQERYRSQRLALHNARYARDEWQRENRRPFWPWRWKRWRQHNADYQRAVDAARHEAKAAKADVSHEALAALEAEHRTHRRALASALIARAQLAELPSEKAQRFTARASEPAAEPAIEAPELRPASRPRLR